MNFTQKSLLTIVGKFSGVFLSLISSIFLARYLGVGGIGQYQLILSAQVFIVAILAMGFGNATIYFINSKKIDKTLIVSNLLKVFFVISLFLIVVLIILMSYFTNYFGKLNMYGIIIFSFGGGSLLLYSIMMPVLYSSLEVTKILVLSLLSTFILLLGIIVFYEINFFNIDVVIAFAGIGNIVATLLLLYFLKDNINFKVKIDILLLKDIFFYGIKLSVTNLVFLLSSNIVIFLLKSLLENGFESVGLFSRATAIANMFILIPMSIGPLLYSKWSTIKQENLHFEIEKTLRILMFISIIGVFGVLIFGNLILLLLYGKEFILAKPALDILSISLIFSSTTIVLTNLFSSIGKPTVTLKIFIGSLLISGISALILIPKFDISGAAASVLIGIMFNAVVLFYIAKKEINLNVLSSFFIKKQDLIWLKNSLIKKN